MASVTPDLRLPSQPQSMTAPWPVPNYTAWWQRHRGVNNLPRVATWKYNRRESNSQSHPITSPTPQPLHYQAISSTTCKSTINNHKVESNRTKQTEIENSLAALNRMWNIGAVGDRYQITIYSLTHTPTHRHTDLPSLTHLAWLSRIFA